MDNPYILKETDDYAVVFKPVKMHCVSLKNSTSIHGVQKDNFGNLTLYDWFTAKSISVYDIMHRLDFETHGLVLFAKNEKSFIFFKNLQDNGAFIKEYSAMCSSYKIPTQADSSNFSSGSFPNTCQSLSGFPQSPVIDYEPSNDYPFFIKSYFRPYGPGRKLVRPVINDGKKHREIAKDKGDFYITEVININNNNFTVQIKRGFRHQIRCHLCWAGFPILNDPLYSHEKISSAEHLALRAHAVFFTDPSTGKPCEYRISPIC